MKILSVIGARPQFIKASAFSHSLSQDSFFQEVIIHTGQHYDSNMSEIFFKTLFSHLPLPKYQLKHGGKPEALMLSLMIESITEIITIEKPDFLLVYGDTTSTLAGALSGVKMKIPIIHIEAGLRSYDLQMPEEQNRVLTDQISTYLFCPTQNAFNHLVSEGFTQDNRRHHYVIENVGDIMLETKNLFLPYAKAPENINFDFDSPFILASCHRQENLNHQERFQEILSTLELISQKIPILFLIHPRNAPLLKNFHSKTITLLPPQGYLSMLFLLKKSQMIITDSGGLQKEAYFFQKSAIVLRQTTEWQELIDLKIHHLCGHKKERILNAFDIIHSNKTDFIPHIYGRGDTSSKIINTLKQRRPYAPF